jgi:hypothetical protein
MAGLGARQHHAPLALQLALEGRQVARPEAGRIGIGDVLRQHGLPTVEPMQPALGQGHRVVARAVPAPMPAPLAPPVIATLLPRPCAQTPGRMVKAR